MWQQTTNPQECSRLLSFPLDPPTYRTHHCWTSIFRTPFPRICWFRDTYYQKSTYMYGLIDMYILVCNALKMYTFSDVQFKHIFLIWMLWAISMFYQNTYNWYIQPIQSVCWFWSKKKKRGGGLISLASNCNTNYPIYILPAFFLKRIFCVDCVWTLLTSFSPSFLHIKVYILFRIYMTYLRRNNTSEISNIDGNWGINTMLFWNYMKSFRFKHTIYISV